MTTIDRIPSTTFHLGHLPISGWRASILGNRNEISIIKSQQTIHCFVKAMIFIAFLRSKGGRILILSGHSEYSSYLQMLLQNRKLSQGILFCHSHWIGGTLTNFQQISRIVSTLTLFSEKIDKFMKKNKIVSTKFQKMKKFFCGFQEVEKPDCLFLISPTENRVVLREARRCNIPVIAITESSTSNALHQYISYPIPGNSDSLFFIYLCLFWITRISHGMRVNNASTC